MSIIINIVLILVSLVLIVAVLMQEGNKQGLGAIGGAAETFLGKNKSKGYEGKLLNITKIGAAVFVVIAIFATWLNARTYTVKYYVDGEEYFPYVETMILMQQMTQGTSTDYETLNAQLPEEEKRATYSAGDTVIQYEPMAKVGYVGAWDKELPEIMDRRNYELNAIYTIGEYTLTFMDGELPEDDEATPDEADEAEDVGQVMYTQTYTYGAEIDQSALPQLPAVEGYDVAWDADIPETMPGNDLTITAVYTLPVEETPIDETPAEATPAEATPAEPAPGTPSEADEAE